MLTVAGKMNLLAALRAQVRYIVVIERNPVTQVILAIVIALFMTVVVELGRSTLRITGEET